MICKFVTGRVRKNRKDAPVTNVDLIVISLRYHENLITIREKEKRKIDGRRKVEERKRKWK